MLVFRFAIDIMVCVCAIHGSQFVLNEHMSSYCVIREGLIWSIRSQTGKYFRVQPFAAAACT